MSSRVELDQEAPTPVAEDQTAQTPEKSEQKGYRELLMVVVIFIVTASFQAGINPPGGVWQDDNDPRYEAGKSIMASKNPSQFVTYIAGVTAAMLVSALQVVVLVIELPINKFSVSMDFLLFAIGFAFSGLGFAYWSSVTALTPRLQLTQVITMLIIELVFGVIGFVFLLLTQKRRSK